MSVATRLALNIPDVLLEIFSHFIPRKSWERPFPPLDISDLSMELSNIDRRSLARCALVCRTWSPFALDLLWAALPDGIGPLLNLIPGYGRFGRGGRDQGLSGAKRTFQVPERVWQRFQQYAIRVKCFIYERRPYGSRLAYGPPLRGVLRRAKLDLASPLLCNLYDMNGGQPLLPNLRILQWRSSTTPARGFALRILAGPRLNAFYIDSVQCNYASFRSEGDLAAIEGDLATLKKTCPRVEHIHITGTHIHEFDPSLDRLTPMCANLRSARFDRVFGNAIVAVLAQVPRLQVVDIELCGSRSLGDLSTPNTFRALRELTARGNPLDIGPFLRSVTSKRLSSIKLLVSAPFPRDIMKCTEPLPLLPCADSLARLHLDMSVHFLSHDDDDDYLPFSALLDNLLSIRQLENIKLYLTCVEVTNADLSAIAAAWPLLRCLKVLPNPEPYERNWRGSTTKPPPIRPSLLSVVDLAMKRPMLEELAVETNYTSHNGLDEIEDFAQHATPHANLVFFDSFTAEDGRLATALSRLFPNATLSWTDLDWP
ncbi:hypothetical protein K466DRAFT_659042 [Polyporus arcularius HHB13444]|uniref:F-box domain-containing protein n=1 Tax=Polyporus arcularius HHB13444 TaxID=1314778 RepID=A0A5C3PT79_9APHY|nr:hypothetical protein K466DRAFT_659042 [Polyporus arcularius HHB13444]